MILSDLNNAKLVKILIIVLFLSSCSMKLFNKKGADAPDGDPEKGTDPISLAIEARKNQSQQEGMTLKAEEKEKFAKINKRTAITDKEKEAREKLKTNQELSIIDKYRLARANRKDFVRNRRTERYKYKIIKKRQSKEMQKRMQKNKRKRRRKDRNYMLKNKWKAFKNLFR